MSYYLLQFDGGAQPNPGKAAGAAVLFNPNRCIVGEVGEYYEKATNNYAEYQGLILGLELALKKGVRRLRVQGDSMLVIQQVKGAWKVSAEALKSLCSHAKDLLGLFEDIILEHVPRAQNSHADSLANSIIAGGSFSPKIDSGAISSYQP